MTQQSSYDNVERQIADYFGASASEAPLSDGFWPRLRARMSLAERGPSLFRRLLERPRLAGSIAAALVLVAVGAITAPLVLGENDQFIARSFATDSGVPEGGFTGGIDDNATTKIGNGGADGGGGFLSASNESMPDAFYDVAHDLDQQAAAPAVEPSPVSASAATQAETSGRSIISTSSVTVEVGAISDAMSQLRGIAESVGGFIESMSTSGGEDPLRGNVTIRIPGAEFFTTIERIKALGTTTNEQVTSEDVSEQVIDLQARLRSEQAKEVSFITLLDRADSVSDVLSIERELSRVRTEIERLEGQLGFIERRVSLASIHVAFTKPAEIFARPPAASIGVETKDVDAKVATVRSLVAAANGEVDSVSSSFTDDRTQAFMVFRVPAVEFGQVMANVEGLGDVTAKEIRQPGSDVDAVANEEPDARIELTLTTPEATGFNWWLWVGAPAGVAVGSGALTALAFIAFNMGRRRADRA